MRLRSLTRLLEVARAVAEPRRIVRLNIVEPERLRQHYQQTPLGERECFTAGRNLTLLFRELGQP